MKRIIIILSVFLLSMHNNFAAIKLTKSIISKNDSTYVDSLNIKSKQSVSVIGVGDIMPGTNFPSKSFLPPNNNCYPLLAQVKHILQNANLTVGNLEGCFSENAPLVKRCKDKTKCYAFRIPVKYSECLKDAGFDVLTLANNHSGDFGNLGRETTVKTLNKLKIAHAGLTKYPYTIFTKDSIKYGIASFSPNNGTVSILNLANATRIVKLLKSKADIVIVTFHGGAEGNKHQHITRKTETFYGENRGNVYKFARTVIDAGADIVFGHGPHVSRAIDLYKNRFIAYSLGNFCTYGRFNLKGPNGIAPIIKINVKKNGEFINGQIFSIKQTGEGVTCIDKENNAVKKIKILTLSDIPESPIQIDDDGFIHIKTICDTIENEK